ncbi:MAG: DUF1015 family protein [Clostridiales bacterium]|nr:DUF1015 family protein [Clostridiales bacterium]
MANIRPFRCIRPNKEAAPVVAALPYDVYSRQEAKAVVAKNPQSFLAIDRAETQFDDSVDLHDLRVYEKARTMLNDWIAQGVLLEDEDEVYYIYALTMDGRTQTGVVACAAVDDYLNGVIKKHENTREDKEQDRICHVDVTNAHTGPIFLAYRADRSLSKRIAQITAQEALYDFTAEDGIRHQVWKVADAADNAFIREHFAAMDAVYIADGHHRAASAVKVGLRRRAANPGYTGEEPFNYFLSVLFADEELMIMPYNRVVQDLNGLNKKDFLAEVEKRFIVAKAEAPVQPENSRHIGMYLDHGWYELAARPEIINDDPVRGLDVSLLQDYLLAPVLGIADPRTDARIQFIGGIRGLAELERLVDGGQAVAFSMYPTSIAELFAVADAGLLMPPKSTWFEPKLRSGLFIHKLV